MVVFLVVGCGRGNDAGTTESATAPPAAQTRSGQTDPGYEALNALTEDGAAAAAGLAGVTGKDLDPGEDPAELVFERGQIDKNEFCSSLGTAAEAESRHPG